MRVQSSEFRFYHTKPWRSVIQIKQFFCPLVMAVVALCTAPAWADNIQCNPGYYLPANATECAICPKGFWCYGGTFTPNLTNQGIGACPRHSTTADTGATHRGMCDTQYCPQTCPVGEISSNCSCVSISEWERGKLHIKYGGDTYVIYDDSNR